MSLLDFSSLLAPINKKHPAGQNLRLETDQPNIYQQIKDARTAARATERQQTQGGEKSAKTHWQTVYKLAAEALTKKSKDLELATWLTESLLREHGFQGLAAGFKLLHELIKTYWEQLYPLPDEDGLISRIAPLTGLNGEEVDGTLIAPIALIPLVENSNHDSFALWQYKQAIELLKIADPEKRNQRINSGWTTLEALENIIANTDPAILQAQRTAITACLDHYQALNTLLDNHCGNEAPPSSRINKILTECLECLTSLTQQHLPAVINTQTEQLNVVESPPSTIAPAILPSQNMTREQVLQNLLIAAQFFRNTEPHSPIPYLLERAVRWGKMELPELLKELVSDSSAQTQLEHLTGIKFS
jgi:type VI secretion system protein ImpA